MARKSTPQPLTLPNPILGDEAIDFSSKSPLGPKSPKTPKSPFRFTNSKKLQGDDLLQPKETNQQPQSTLHQTSLTLPSLAHITSGQENTKQEQRERSSRSGFFSNYKAAKSSSRLQSESTTVKPILPEENMSRDTDQPAMSGRVSSKDALKTEPTGEKPVSRRPVGGHSKSEESVESPPGDAAANTKDKKGKPKPFSLLSRTKSIRDDSSPRETSPTEKIAEQPEKSEAYDSMKTAPLLAEGDRSFRSMMASSVRQHSADRVPRSQRSRSRDQKEKKPKDGSISGRSHTAANLAREHNRNPTSMSTSASGHTFLNSLKSQATKGAGGLSKALFGKGGRSGSTTERVPEVSDEHYHLKVLTLPLVEQTRLTRISKKLEDSRDKTEFWMPSFPWRAIDYLNYKGSEEEGLYRISGSLPVVKSWQRRFDEQLDLDLFEQPDLYDINIVGSMLKAWLRDLPDDIFPKDAQQRINDAKPPGDADPDVVPPILIEELSNLPPFNYYLLFAITCHLSLLLQHKAKNKMDFRNLCICFQPCLRVDNYCFKYLVVNWRDCWKGCKTEGFYVEQEYIFLDQIGSLLPSSAEGLSSTAVESSHEERNVSSSDSSKPSSVTMVIGETSSNGRQENGNSNARQDFTTQPKPAVKLENQSKIGPSIVGLAPLPLAQPPGVSSTVSTTLTVVDERERDRIPASRRNNNNLGPDMRPLSPIKPLSPLGF